MAPNWHATASNAPSANGSASASACCQATSAVSIRAAARSSIGRLRSVAMMGVPAGRARTRARGATGALGAGRGLELRGRREGGEPGGEVAGVGLGQQRPEVAVVGLGDR